MSARPPAASIHGLDVSPDGSALVVTGTCRRPGVTGEQRPTDVVRLHLVDADGRRRLGVVTAPAQRFEDGALTWTGFTASLPAADLPVGHTFPVLEIAGGGDPTVEVPAMAAIGMTVSSRPLLAGDRVVQAVPARGSDRAEIICHGAGRARWRAAMAARDVVDLVRRRPFSWGRLARVLTTPLTPRGPVWLVGERPDTARDNGYHLFAYLRRERPDITAYFVIDRSSDQYATVAGLGRVVAHSSWRHRVLMLHASVLANAYSIKHMVPRQWDPRSYMRNLAWRVGAHRVYLKHGVQMNTTALRRRVGGYDLYLTSSDAESAACRATSGYDRQVVQTGLPRYDALLPTPPSRTVLFMPTWRLYLAPALFGDGGTGTVPFEGSDYQRFVEGFLTNPRLHDLLERHDYRLQLMPHYNLGTYLADVPVASPRVEVVDGASGNIQDLIRDCDLFVTDHSSVHFDVAYLGTPVVYAHFDAEDYASGHAGPSWFDHDRDGFGPVVTTVDATLDAVEHYLGSGCRREETYAARAQAAFAFHDTDNSRRTVEAIEDLLRPRGAG